MGACALLSEQDLGAAHTPLRMVLKRRLSSPLTPVRRPVLTTRAVSEHFLILRISSKLSGCCCISHRRSRGWLYISCNRLPDTLRRHR